MVRRRHQLLLHTPLALIAAYPPSLPCKNTVFTSSTCKNCLDPRTSSTISELSGSPYTDSLTDCVGENRDIARVTTSSGQDTNGTRENASVRTSIVKMQRRKILCRAQLRRPRGKRQGQTLGCGEASSPTEVFTGAHILPTRVKLLASAVSNTSTKNQKGLRLLLEPCEGQQKLQTPMPTRIIRECRVKQNHKHEEKKDRAS